MVFLRACVDEILKSVCEQVWTNNGYATEHQGISENVIEKAFLPTEECFPSLVNKQWLSKPQIASAGSCCLVGIICNGLYGLQVLEILRWFLAEQKEALGKSQLFNYPQSTMQIWNQ